MKNIWRVFAALLVLLMIPQAASAATPVKLADFGDRGLALYLDYAKDLNMFRAMVAADLAEGRSIAEPNSAYLSRMADSMSLSPNTGIQDYINYYTASSSLKTKINEQSARLSGIMATVSDKAFPLPAGVAIWYADNWHAYRGDNGERLHEGIDITCPMGTPVRSMGAGVVEKLGWNGLGGWRVGIRGTDGLYYYYAHLSGFAKGIAVGTNVAMGQTIGYSGDSGNGPEGTTGMYEPHLHIGIYEGRSNMTAQNPYGIIRLSQRNRW